MTDTGARPAPRADPSEPWGRPSLSGSRSPTHLHPPGRLSPSGLVLHLQPLPTGCPAPGLSVKASASVGSPFWPRRHLSTKPPPPPQPHLVTVPARVVVDALHLRVRVLTTSPRSAFRALKLGLFWGSEGHPPRGPVGEPPPRIPAHVRVRPQPARAHGRGVPCPRRSPPGRLCQGRTSSALFCFVTYINGKSFFPFFNSTK